MICRGQPKKESKMKKKNNKHVTEFEKKIISMKRNLVKNNLINI